MTDRVLFISEYINPPYDEGIRKTVRNLFLELDTKYDLKTLCREGDKNKSLFVIKANKLFFSQTIKNHIKEFDPHAIIYFPFSSTTFASYLRFFILTIYAKNSKQILISLQPKPLKIWQKALINFIKPKYALTPSPELYAYWKSIKVCCKLMPLYTNLNAFQPVDNRTRKMQLREKYHLPVDDIIIIHMGHLNSSRNLDSLFQLKKEGIQVVIVASSSTPKDSIGPASIKQDLIDQGIIIIDRLIPQIEELYQLADIYIFPVVKRNSSIGLPLSILEARSCGIPVITTEFGSVKHFLGHDHGSIYYSNPEKFKITLEKIIEELDRDFKKTDVHLLNKEYLEIIHNSISRR